MRLTFPISRDPPEGGTLYVLVGSIVSFSFQFLGIPPKGEQSLRMEILAWSVFEFPISRDPPEGGTPVLQP